MLFINCKTYLTFKQFGDYYCIDNVGATHDALKTQFKVALGDSFEYYFGLLYSLYSLPNIVIPFIGGLLVMKFGVRTMYVVFGAFIMIGQFIFAMGCQYTSINTMLLGRVIFGLGGESLNICQNAMIVKWFFKSQIALPLGLTISVSRLGSVLNDIGSPRLVSQDFNVSPALWVGFGVCIVSFIASLILCWVDISYDKQNGINENNFDDDSLASVSTLKEMGPLFWLITLLCITLYGAVLPFNYIASGFLTETHFKNISPAEAQSKAGLLMSVPFFISAFMVPIYGILIDKYGQRAYLSLLASFCGLLCFTMFYYLTPIWPLILLGMTYSMFASVIWPAISLVVKTDLVGFAYGVTTSLQNAGLSLFPIIVSVIYSNSKSYINTLSFFISLMILSIVISFVLISVNSHCGDIINKTSFEEDKGKDEEEKKVLIKQLPNSSLEENKVQNYSTIDS